MGIHIQMKGHLDLIVHFHGRPILPITEHNPGSHLSDDRYTEKLVKLAHQENSIIFYSTSDHSGEITLIDSMFKATNLINNKNVVVKKTSEKRVGLVMGDGIVCHRSLPQPVILALRTWDCIPLVVCNDTHFGVLHISNTNLIGYHQSNFSGSILKSLFKFFEPKNCHIIIGPSIGGIYPDHCWHYEYTQNSEQKDGSDLVKDINKEYPDIDIRKFMYENRGKMYFQWGEIILKILEYHGVNRCNIHRQYNLCTMCYKDIFYSYRAAKLKNDPREMDMRYGNMTLVSTKN